jgi:predicted nucleic acid-binding protein
VIYIDTSVLLAQLLAEDRRPDPALWTEPLVTSRLTEYELWTRVHARGLARTHGEALLALLGRVAVIELAPAVLTRATEPFPLAVRTLDALHLASAHWLREQGQEVRVASYDARLSAAAEAIGFDLGESWLS